MFISALSLVVFACIPVTQGWASGILHALDTSGLDQFANATASLDGTPSQYILSELSQGNNAIFAPTDSACASLLISCARDISYHAFSV